MKNGVEKGDAAKWCGAAAPELTLVVKDTGTAGIYTDSPAWGGLSGCTVSESISWGKYTADSVAAEVKCDATIAMPLLVAGLFERMGLRGPDAA